MRRLLSLAVALIAGCARPTPPSTSLFFRPWPSEADRASDGAVDLSRFPRGTGAPLRREVEDTLRGVRGFGLSSGIFFPFGFALDPDSLPSVDASPDDASVFVVALDGASAGERAPVDVRFFDDAGPFGGTDLLAVLPYPGIPLAPETLYAAVVTTRVRDAEGARLEPASPLDRADADALETVGVRREEIARLTTFRTGDPTRGLLDAFAHADAQERPQLDAPPTLAEEHERYCVFTTTVGMPVYQAGEPPYLEAGGGWVQRADGSLVRQRIATARVVISVPRARAEEGGYPGAVFVRTGGGGDRPLVDRGPHDATARAEPGSGYARDLAEAGYVGATVDGPLGGARNRAGWDEQFVLYDMLNPVALRDNIRQSALELALFASVLEELDFDASACRGASERVRIRPGLTLIGHSNGATVAPLAAAAQPRYRALVLGGAGASWIRQALYKQNPAPTRPVMSLLFGYALERQTFEHDPMLSLLQWAGEPADPVVYGRLLRDRDVLVFQGVLDTYIPPPISNPLALSLGLDLAGPALDEDLRGYRSLTADLPLAGLGRVGLPTSGAQGGRTRVLTQIPADGLEDGHEVMFQQPIAHEQLGCFLSTLAAGVPRVPGVSGGSAG